MGKEKVISLLERKDKAFLNTQGFLNSNIISNTMTQENQNQKTNSPTNNTKNLIALMLFFLFLVVGFVSIYLIETKRRKEQMANTNTNTPLINTNIAATNTPTNDETKTTTEPSRNLPTTEAELDSDLDTSSWLTYSNEEWGFEVRYPRDFHVTPSNFPKTATENISKGIVIISSFNSSDHPYLEKNELNIDIGIFQNQNIPFEEWFEKNVHYKDGYSRKSGQQIVKVYKNFDFNFDYPVIVEDLIYKNPIEGYSGFFRYVFISYKDRIFELRGQMTYNTTQQEVFKNIVDTFKFIDK